MGVDEIVGVRDEASPEVARRVLAWLGSAGAEELTEAESLDLIALMESVKGAAAAVQARVTDRFVTGRDAETARALAHEEIDPAHAKRARAGTRCEVALARRCSPALADRHVGLAIALSSEMHHTMAALQRGEVSEWRATLMVRETACLSAADRTEVDRRVGPDLPQLGDRAIIRAAQRVAVELDQESVVARRARAAASRRVSVRPAADGMAYLSVLGPLAEVVGAYAAMTAAERSRWATTGDPRIDALRAGDTRGVGEWMADTALARLSGREEGQVQPVEINLVMTPGALLPELATGSGSDARVEIPGWGTAPAEDIRTQIRRLIVEAGDEGGLAAGVWLRRLFTSPDERDLVSMDSSRRRFGGALRTFVQLRDPTCRFPWCDAPTRDIDHITRHADGGATSGTNGMGLCHRHNQIKELPGWRVTVEVAGHGPPGDRSDRSDLGHRTHAVAISTPAGRLAFAAAPPILGIGTTWHPPLSPAEQYYQTLLAAAA